MSEDNLSGIPHNKLMEKVGNKISDGRVLELIESYLKAGVMETGKGWEATPEGTPQGGVISPLLANIYLNDLDWELAHAGLQIVRYADDFVVLCRNWRAGCVMWPSHLCGVELVKLV